MCAEGLSAMLEKAETDGKIVGIKVCRTAPSVNHLFFADDSLILMRARNEEASELKRILEVYERVWGQMINKDKSSILFSPNTERTIRVQLKATLSISQEKWGERYLGLPVSIGKSKKKTFAYIKQRIWCRVQGWQEKMLSKAGKEILVKAVAQAIPTYAMSCFDITKTLCDQISAMVCRYWWSQQDKTNKIHWLSWEKLTRSKKKGGLGFRDLHLFNISMLARQAWRLLSIPDSLCGRVLKAKYFPHHNILECQAKGGISYSWRSILQGVDLLKKGLIWRVGDGRHINIWTDPWIPRDGNRQPSTPRGASLLTRVEELIDPGTGDWDEQLVYETFWEEEAEVILTIPIGEDTPDWPAWHFDSKGRFSVKSAYKLAVQTRDTEAGREAGTSAEGGSTANYFPWHKIWLLKVPNKVQMFFLAINP